MNKIIASFMAMVIALLSLPMFFITVWAIDTEYYVADYADLIDNDSGLSETLEDISLEYDCDVVIVTVESLDGKTSQEYADDYYDYNDYTGDGILLLICPEYRDWAISTTGYGIKAFTDYGQEYIIDRMSDALSDDDYEEAFDIFAENCEMFLEEAENDRPYDVDHKVMTTRLLLNMILISAIIGIFVAVLVGYGLCQQLKSVRAQKNAHSYVDRNSIKITERQDIFLYKTVSKTKRERSSSSGGSSTHSGSSGTSHGGSSGKY